MSLFGTTWAQRTRREVDRFCPSIRRQVFQGSLFMTTNTLGHSEKSGPTLMGRHPSTERTTTKASLTTSSAPCSWKATAWATSSRYSPENWMTEVVRNERRQRYENPPYGDVWGLLSENMFPAEHPYPSPPLAVMKPTGREPPNHKGLFQHVVRAQ